MKKNHSVTWTTIFVLIGLLKMDLLQAQTPPSNACQAVSDHLETINPAVPKALTYIGFDIVLEPVAQDCIISGTTEVPEDAAEWWDLDGTLIGITNGGISVVLDTVIFEAEELKFDYRVDSERIVKFVGYDPLVLAYNNSDGETRTRNIYFRSIDLAGGYAPFTGLPDNVRVTNLNNDPATAPQLEGEGDLTLLQTEAGRTELELAEPASGPGGGGACQLNPTASPQGLVFGFGWFGLVGLVLASLRKR